ncbi:MAG TPA: rhodanese-like domain-containing protein [Thermoanaerobaculia bacterium]|nr:rhodanese-like domain-containing protein [Thermoanaerobaculia bacterium]
MMRTIAATLGILLLTSACTVGVSRRPGGYAEIQPEIAHEMILDNRQIVVLDLRPSEDYEARHIGGAISAPFHSIEHTLPLLLPYQNATLIVYADDADESVRGASLLVAAGFRNVVRMSGGLDGWIDKGFPVASSR